MNIKSAKSKGRRCAQEVKNLILENAPDLIEGDVTITSASVTGEDLHLSPRARELFNWAIECKNTEAINVWASYAQSEAHARGTNKTPILFFKRNRSKLMVCMSAEDFFKTVKQSF